MYFKSVKDDLENILDPKSFIGRAKEQVTFCFDIFPSRRYLCINATNTVCKCILYIYINTYMFLQLVA